MRRIERPVGGAGARQADRAPEQPQQRPLERDEAGLDDASPPARGRSRRPARDARTRRSATRSPPRSSSARCADASRAAPPPGARAGVEGGERGRRRDAARGGDEEEARAVAAPRPRPGASGSGVTRSPRPSTSAGPPARKNGTSEPSRAARRGGPRVERRRPTPRARRRPSRRRRRCRRRGRRRPGSACRAGRRAAAAARAAPLGTGGTSRGGDRRAGRGCRRPGPGRCPSTWSVSSPPGGSDREREAIRQVQRDHHAVQVVEAVGPATEDRQRQVDLGRREPDDRRRGAGRGSAVTTRGSASAGFRDVAEGLGERDPLPDRDASAGVGRGRSRSPRAPRRRAPARSAAGASARCGASSAVPGSPPGRRATAVPRPRRRAGRRPGTARARAPRSRPWARARRRSRGTRKATRAFAWYWQNTDR